MLKCHSSASVAQFAHKTLHVIKIIRSTDKSPQQNKITLSSESHLRECQTVCHSTAIKASCT